jgi:hypothetical protein
MKGHAKLKKAIIISVSCVLFVALVLSFFWLGERKALGIDRYTPDYDKIDITPILSKDTLTDEDYALLYAQTGLTRLGIDAMLDEGDITKIVEVQESFFKEYEYRDLNFAPFCHYYSLKGTVPIVPLQDGDIIISSSTEFSWWSIGHCAMVVDAKNGITVEAIGVGDDSTYGYVSALSRRPTLIVLRPKLEKEEISKIVEYVDSELLGITYDPTVGVLSRKYNEEIGATQCAHIFWYAFYKHGYDIDSNGGAVVTPKDIANSEYFEVVQVSGFNPQTLWGN